MSEEQNKDRRVSYSFKQHFQRALATKGLRRLLAPMLGTAIAASVAFAYCGSDGITGPSRHDDGGGGGGAGGIEVTPIDVTPDDIPTELAEIEVPTTMQATACNGDIVAWEDARTKASGTQFFNPKTLSFRTVIRIKQWAKGPGTVFPRRYYSGYQEYEKESFAKPGSLEEEHEYELDIIAKGEKDTRLFNDDYKLRLRVVILIKNGAFTIRSSTHEKCY